MVELNARETNTKQRAGVSKLKRLNTRVDLTPMVDLGFLLITFFIFTTTMSQPASMRLIVPNDTGEDTPIKESGALTLLPAGEGKVYYYFGKSTHMQSTTIDKLRDVVMEKKSNTPEVDFVVVIKPADDASYGDLIDVLDEMTINDVKRYAVVDITRLEEAMMR